MYKDIMESSYKYVIVGAGLSGLVTAYKLLQCGEEDFIILEARDRVGGRVLTQKNIDLGATWLQSYHTALLSLLDELDVKIFDQFSEGQSILVYNSMAPAHYFEVDSKQPSSKRIVGGTSTVIQALFEKVKDKIRINEVVHSIEEVANVLKINTGNKLFKADKVIVTLPPFLASEINYFPSLPRAIVEVMEGTHTWMSNAIKVGVSFDKPFWKEKGFSGTIIGQAAPMVELYDHSNKEGTVFSLKGFANESLRELSKEERKVKILLFLEKHLGSQVKDYINYLEKDWSLERFTSADQLKSYYLSPNYGNELFQKSYLNSKLLFSGTETSDQYGGYLEGAVLSGINAFNKMTNQAT